MTIKKSHLRPANTVMNLERLGSSYPYRLSFMRILIRRIMKEKWQIERTTFELDKKGYGDAIYEIRTPKKKYSFVVFADFLDPGKRSDRVIADQWDITVALCEGSINQSRLEKLRKNVPLQEKGRMDSKCIVLSRANKSTRNFEYVIGRLASGRQPSLSVIAKVGYLYRTTAVYGSGKFGMADWQKVKSNYQDFSQPFAAEMFTCYLIRQFSIEQADFLAREKSPDTAVSMHIDIKRYIGIGNATGLGMAPFLINHPLLINHWIEIRETALARVFLLGEPNKALLKHFVLLANRAKQHLKEISIDNEQQNSINYKTSKDIALFIEWLELEKYNIKQWTELADHATKNTGIEAQELINTILIELHPELTQDLENTPNIEESYELVPEMLITSLRDIIRSRYAWALDVDFTSNHSNAVFWYRSEEKMEPRLGQRNSDPGADREMMVGVARLVRQCYDGINRLDSNNIKLTVAQFVFFHPQYRLIIRRIQTMSKTQYGDIQANLLDEGVLPIHLLRCKLSFFGVGKFDPKSRLWVRNTMFQGAPIQSDIGSNHIDDWFFPIMPFAKQDKGNEHN